VRTEPDGRIAVSFINIGTAEVPYTVRGRCVRRAGNGCAPFAAQAVRSATAPSSTTAPAAAATPSREARLAERAHADREIVYFFQQPETHSFDLYHDYTESRPGMDKYINVVRAGSRVSRPSAKILDTGVSLTYEIMKGPAITAAKLDIGEPVTPATEVVVIRFPAVRQGQSVRLRLSETYTDSVRYRIDNDELVWDRSFGRPSNAIVLPSGWYLTNSSIPGTVSLTDDGRLRVDFVNPRNDDIAVLLTARRRPK
jgi:hypothetical protein